VKLGGFSWRTELVDPVRSTLDARRSTLHAHDRDCRASFSIQLTL
jgi:hypothetical protein